MESERGEILRRPERFLDRTFVLHMVLVAGLLALIFRPFLFEGRIPSDLDNLFYFYPQRALIHDGAGCFWNPYQFSGFPAYRDPVMALFYPPSWLFRIVPVREGTVAIVLGHYALAAAGFLWLGFLLRLPATARLAGALAFALGSHLLGRFLNHSLLFTAAYAPWVLGSFERAVATGRLRCVAAAAGFQALQILSGMPHNAAFMLMALAGYGVWSALRERRIAPLGIGALVVALALGLSAVQWVPTYAGVREGVRQTQTYREACDLALSPAWIPEFLLGGTDRPQERINEFLEVSCYPGAVVVLLAPFAFWHARRRLVWFLVGVFLCAALLALGPATVAHRGFYHLPGGKFFNIPGRFLFLAAWSVPLLGALGLARLLDRSASGWMERLLLLFFAVLGIGLLAMALFAWEALWTTVMTPWAIGGETFMVANLLFFGTIGFGLLAAFRRGRIGARTFGMLFALLLSWDLVHFSQRLKREYVSADALAPTPTIQELRRLVSNEKPCRVLGFGGNFSRPLSAQESIARALLLPKLANVHHLQDVQGYSPMHTLRYNQTLLLSAGSVPGAATLRWLLIRDPEAPILDLLGTRYILGEPHDRLVVGQMQILRGLGQHTVELTDWEGGARELLLISCLDYSADLPQGTKVGEVVIRNASNELRVLPVRAGIETADFRLGRPGVPEGHRQIEVHRRVPELTPQLHGTIYVARIPFEPIAAPTELEIRRTMAEGVLVLMEASLTRDGSGKFRKIHEADGIRLYENAEAFPRTWWVERAETVSDWRAALAAVNAAAVDPATVVLVESEESAEGGRESLAGRFPREKWAEPRGAKVVAWRPGLLQVEVEAPKDGYLVVGEMDDFGWRVTVDGKPSPRLRANAIMMATPVPPGRHRVRFRFRPEDVYLGGGISLVTLLVLGFVCSGRIPTNLRPR